MESFVYKPTAASNPAPELNLGSLGVRPNLRRLPLEQDLASFIEFGQPTRRLELAIDGTTKKALVVPVYINEFWTARQRQAHSLHEVSYRACFKPQLPRFFIERLSEPGDPVHDPFMGRGTTPLEAALLGRVPLGNDVNPLSEVLLRPRLHPPEPDVVHR